MHLAWHLVRKKDKRRVLENQCRITVWGRYEEKVKVMRAVVNQIRWEVWSTHQVHVALLYASAGVTSLSHLDPPK